jgi:hypothetical protein
MAGLRRSCTTAAPIDWASTPTLSLPPVLV